MVTWNAPKYPVTNVTRVPFLTGPLVIGRGRRRAGWAADCRLDLPLVPDQPAINLRSVPEFKRIQCHGCKQDGVGGGPCDRRYVPLHPD